MECSCACGATRFHTLGVPLFRILCHCELCQQFHNAPFADVLVHRSDDVPRPPAKVVDFTICKPPPNVRRGRCTACGQPAIAVFEAPILPRLVMVPSSMFRKDERLMSPVAHIFYDKRVADSDDPYPKHTGYLRSQFAFLKYLYAAMRN